MGGVEHLAIRREPIEYGIPIASWLPHIDCPAALNALLNQLIEAGELDENRCADRLFVHPPKLLFASCEAEKSRSNLFLQLYDNDCLSS